MNILQAIDDPALFKPWFRDPATWAAWRVFLAALFGLRISLEQQDTWRQWTGRVDLPRSPAEGAWLICGRRAGKPLMLALIATYLGCFRDYRPYLQPGERGTIIVVQPIAGRHGQSCATSAACSRVSRCWRV
jgi:hypothetical protein